MAKNAHCPPAQALVQERRECVPADWLLPDWPAPSHVHALFTTRSGGVSQSEYTSMNLGDHVGDERQAVALNRARLAAALHGITPGTRPVFLNQVHGSQCQPLSNATPDGTACDAVFATAPGQACTIMVADCLPVLITDLAGSKVAAAHAGWRGLAGGVLEAAVGHFQAAAQSHKASKAINFVANDRLCALDTEPHGVAVPVPVPRLLAPS